MIFGILDLMNFTRLDNMIKVGGQMKVEKLLSLIPYYQMYTSRLSTNLHVKNIRVESRKVNKGDAFICIRGYKEDGHDYAFAAEAQGAAVVIAERKLDIHIPQIIVPDTTRALALIANAFYENPTQNLNVIGITGTNGKTSITYILEAIFQAHKMKTGIIGTIQKKIGNESYETENTTPHALELQHTFSRMLKSQVDVCMMEVSSHALDLGRVFGCDFNLAIYTNLSQDHLDYHKSMDAYFHSKSLLFSQLGNEYCIEGQKHAIINIDDSYADQLKKVTSQHILTYGINKKADVFATDICYSSMESTFTLHTPIGSIDINTPLIGSFNVYNMLAATCAAILNEVPLQTIASTLEKMQGIDGRFEQVMEGQPFSVIVDYAHTPDSLENVLCTVNEFAKGHVYVVVGCGGDRDRTKRRFMAQIATKFAHRAIFTSDNPRTENPKHILSDMIEELEASNFTTIMDRKEAIQFAVEKAEQDDIIIIAGKGHETDQTIGNQKFEFDDRTVAAEAIRLLDRK